MTANTNPLPAKVDRFYGEIQFARRSCIDKYHPAEKAIRDALIAVESLGADLLLTQAVMLLAEAQDKVADWLEGGVGTLAAPAAPLVGPNEAARCMAQENGEQRCAKHCGLWECGGKMPSRTNDEKPSPASPAGVPTQAAWVDEAMALAESWLMYARMNPPSDTRGKYLRDELERHLRHLPACDSSEASGSAIPARPTLPGEELDVAGHPKLALSALEWLAVDACNRVKAWAESDRKAPFPEEAHALVDGVLMMAAQRREGVQ